MNFRFDFSKNDIKLNRNLIYLSCGLLIVTALVIFNLAFYLYRKNPRMLGVSDQTPKEIIFWKDFLAQNPDYKNGWLKLAILEYKQGNISEVNYSLDMAEALDPNSEELKNLKNKMGL